MDTIKILIAGYARSGKNGTYIASPTTTLIFHQDKMILVDPGTNAPKLMESLKRENLTPQDIDILFLSHYHPDHFLNIRLFPTHPVYDGTLIWKGEQEISYNHTLPGTNLEVIPTPGHAQEQASIIVHTKEFGLVCIAQDVWWWEDGQQKSETVADLMSLEDPFVWNKEELRKSREKVLNLADWIIPGHGKMFKNPKKD